MKKILVTGGAGFIGSHTVVELVNAGFSPVIIDNFSNTDERILRGLNVLTGGTVTLYREDCCDRAMLQTIFQREKPDGVIHFAAFKAVGESVADPLKYYHNNLESLVSLLAVMREFDVTNLVFSSSCTVYGTPDHNPVSELTPIQTAGSPYGRTKQMCEDIIRDQASSGAPLKAALLRYFNPVGAHPSALIGELPFGVPNNLVPYITQTAAGIRDALTVFGGDYSTPDGTCVRDFIHVVDLALAHVHALSWLTKQEDPVEVFNLGQGRGNSVLEVIHTFSEVAGQSVNWKMGPRRSGDVPQIWADVSKADQILGWRTKLTLADALRDAWKWQQTLMVSESN